MPTEIRPNRIRLEASSVCQLRCPACPAHGRAAHTSLGNGFLKLSDFRDLITSNPQLESIELANYGEIFLNPELLQILRFAHERGVALTANTGANLNRVGDDVLQGLVEYEFQSLCCSIDGASEESYGKYRVNGSLPKVLENIRTLNALKAAHGSELPRLTWQFVVFGHNEHEVERARQLAGELGMTFRLKLSWDEDFSPPTDVEMLRKEFGAARRSEYRQRHGADYVQHICQELWDGPQINWDGRVLGCCRNFWGDFGSNAFTDGLIDSVNSPRLQRAREMLLGTRPAEDGIPCSTCDIYLGMRDSGRWLVRETPAATGRSVRATRFVRRAGRAALGTSKRLAVSLASCGSQYPRLTGSVYPLAVPLLLEDEGWRPSGMFVGSLPGVGGLFCHASALAPGACPHTPHTHDEEEILLLLSGQVELILPDASPRPGEDRMPLRPGQFVFYPSGFPHTLQTTGEAPAEYLMVRWRGGSRHARSKLGFGLYDAVEAAPDKTGADGFRPEFLFEGPTRYLRKLHCHRSSLAPEGGYDPHVDDHHVLMIVLEGVVETLGCRIEPHGVILSPAGEPHGIRNPGEKVARYLVIEMHASSRRR